LVSDRRRLEKSCACWATRNLALMELPGGVGLCFGRCRPVSCSRGREDCLNHTNRAKPPLRLSRQPVAEQLAGSERKCFVERGQPPTSSCWDRPGGNENKVDPYASQDISPGFGGIHLTGRSLAAGARSLICPRPASGCYFPPSGGILMPFTWSREGVSDAAHAQKPSSMAPCVSDGLARSGCP
jgi:hypothetical protein